MDELVTRIYLNVDDLDLEGVETDIYVTESLIRSIKGNTFKLFIRENSQGFFIGSTSMAYFREHGIPPVIENLVEKVEHMFTLPRNRKNSLPSRDLGHQDSKRQVYIRDSPFSELLLRITIVAPTLKEMLKLKELVLNGELRAAERQRKNPARKKVAKSTPRHDMTQEFRLFDHRLINRIQGGYFVAHECQAHIIAVDDDGKRRPHLWIEIKGPTQAHIKKCLEAIKQQADSNAA